jgi:cell division protein FtsB
LSQKSNGWYWIGILALMAGIVYYADAKDIIGVHEDYVQSEVKLETLSTEVEDLEEKKDTLNREIKKLGADSFSMEKRIRLDGERVRKDETVYRIELPENE